MMWTWGGGWLAGIWMLLFWAGIVLLVVWTVRASSGSEPAPDRALDILEQRFARGEIDVAEFEERRRTLSGS